MTKANLIKELDRVFSIAVRKQNADSFGMVKCVTCPTKQHWANITCGHYRKRRHMSTRWLLKNCAPQCAYCNGPLQGNDAEFERYLEYTHGAGTVQRLIELSNQEVHYNAIEVEEMIHEFKKLI